MEANDQLIQEYLKVWQQIGYYEHLLSLETWVGDDTRYTRRWLEKNKRRERELFKTLGVSVTDSLDLPGRWSTGCDLAHRRFENTCK